LNPKKNDETKIHTNTVLATIFVSTAVVFIGGLIVLPTATMQSASAAGEGGGCGTGGCSAGFGDDEGSGYTGGWGMGSGTAYLPGSTDTSRASAFGGGGYNDELHCGSGAFLVSSPGTIRAGGGGSCPSEPEPDPEE
jgi:hypothetical protein